MSKTYSLDDRRAVEKWLEIICDCLYGERVMPANRSPEEIEEYYVNLGRFVDAVDEEGTRWVELPPGFRLGTFSEYLVSIGYMTRVSDYFEDYEVKHEYENPLGGGQDDGPPPSDIYAIVAPPDDAYALNGIEWKRLIPGKRYEFFTPHVLLQVTNGMGEEEAADRLRELADLLDSGEIDEFDGLF